MTPQKTKPNNANICNLIPNLFTDGAKLVALTTSTSQVSLRVHTQI